MTSLELGHSYHVRDLVLDGDVHVVTDPGRTVASIVTPKLREEVAPAEEAVPGEEAAEPEVVGKKEEEEEEKKEEEEEGQRKRRER